MTLILEILTLLAVLGLLVWSLVQKHYLSSYLSEKGRKLAEKEDIAAVTKLVENVRHSFTQQTEELKAELGVLSSTRINLLSEERDAIIAYYQALHLFIRVAGQPKIPPPDADDAAFFAVYDQILSAHADLERAGAAFELFVEDEKLREKKVAVQIGAIQRFMIAAPEVVGRLQAISIQVRQVKTTLSQVQETLRSNAQNESFVGEAKSAIEQAPQRISDLMKQYTELTREHSERFVAENQKFAPQLRDFSICLRNHLFRLISGGAEKEPG